jgi:hypothetical protein
VFHHQSRRKHPKEKAVKRAVLWIVVAALCLAQPSRDDYRAAYRAWWEADTNLEQDAAAGGPTVAERAGRLAEAAAKFAASHKAFLEGNAEDEAQQISWLEGAPLAEKSPALSTKSDTQFIAAETTAVTRTIETFANDQDTGMQRLSAALARERAALDALGVAVAQRKKAAEVVTDQMEQTRAKALEFSRTILEGFKEAAAGTGRESAAWSDYYRKIGEEAQGPATPITEVPAGVEAVTVNNPVPAPPTVTPLPLGRYLGPWIYQSNGEYHGLQPEFLDVMVHDDNGHVTGTVFGRFKLPPPGTGDPVLGFDFSGDLQSTRNQVFHLVTREGAKGTVELIPGDAVNLLEVKFETEERPGKVQKADAVLVKK